MNIYIYANEIQDGLAEIIAAQNSVACVSHINEYIPSENLKDCKVLASSANPSQPDLFYFRSVHVSSGWNNNDDVFLRDELLKSWASCTDKQTNYMHKETEIIGHITAQYLADFENNIISIEDAIKLNDVNVITDAVIYKSWANEELQAKYSQLIEEIRDGKWGVSMECIFNNFDYVLKHEDGSQRVIARDEKTSYLSKHLRAYGGTGVYLNYKIGRILRNFVFSGQGVVDRPANPRSLILKTKAGEINNMDEIMKELEACKAELASAKQTIESLTEFKTKAETLETSFTQSAQELATAKEQLDSLKSQIEELNKTLAQVKTEKDELASAKEALAASYDEMKKKMKGEKRKAALVEVGLEDADIETSLASFDSLDDDAFDKIVAMMKKTKSKMPKEDKKEESSASLVVEVEKTKASLNEAGVINEKTTQEKFAEHFKNTLKLKKK